MDQTKKWWESTGVWGSAVAIGASAAGMAGYAIGPADQAAIVTTATHGAQLAVEIASFAGGVVALWGRLTATHRIG